MNFVEEGAQAGQTPRWRPLGAVERRVLGVLIEKAKTTPEYYPMTVAAICTGCNQKSCRSPLMQLEPEDVEEALERLREVGAVGYVEGMGRAPKFRHYAYEWFGVNKQELAVLAELLLRGPQTEGQLRAHVSRMEPIQDLSQIRSLIKSLKDKGLVVSLTPETRGHIVSHTLYLPHEMEKIRRTFAAEAAMAASMSENDASESSGENIYERNEEKAVSRRAIAATFPSEEGTEPVWEQLLRQVEILRQELAEIRQQLNQLAQAITQNGSELSELRRRVEQLF